MVKPGVPYKQFHDIGAELLTEAMLDLGLLTGRKADLISSATPKVLSSWNRSLSWT